MQTNKTASMAKTTHKTTVLDRRSYDNPHAPMAVLSPSNSLSTFWMAMAMAETMKQALRSPSLVLLLRMPTWELNLRVVDAQ
jgi:hypothetical protein